MTTEEAIKHLWYDWYILGDGRLVVDGAEEFQEAIGLAITALRAQTDFNGTICQHSMAQAD